MIDTCLPQPAPATRILRLAGYAAPERRYAFNPRGGTADAAAQLDLDEHRIIKTLIFDNNATDAAWRAVVVLMHGDRRVSLHKLERLTGTRRLRPSAPDTAERLTGYLPGGISPFGMKTVLPLFGQDTLTELNPLYMNAGQRGVIVEICPAALERLFPCWGDLQSPASRR